MHRPFLVTVMTSTITSSYNATFKGKSRDITEYQDLDPVMTFRHLHSRTMGVRDPLRVVALCDMDAFFASCEQVRLGVDSKQPLVVIQWNTIIAVNHAARKFGIQRWARPKVSEATQSVSVLFMLNSKGCNSTVPGASSRACCDIQRRRLAACVS